MTPAKTPGSGDGWESMVRATLYLIKTWRRGDWERDVIPYHFSVNEAASRRRRHSAGGSGGGGENAASAMAAAATTTAVIEAAEKGGGGDRRRWLGACGWVGFGRACERALAESGEDE
jgi:hypothetical protein